MDSLTPPSQYFYCRRWTAIIVAIGLALFASPWVGAEVPHVPPGYLQAIQQELARLDMPAQCDVATNTCRYQTNVEIANRPQELTIRYSPQTDTVYICFEQFLRMENNVAPPASLAVRLLGLNREMVAAKFEWDEETKAIRLSATLNTDANFDRRAFRSQIKGLLQIAKAVGPTLTLVSEETK